MEPAPPTVYYVFLDGEQVHGIDFDLVKDNIKTVYLLLGSMYPCLDVFDLRLKIQRVGNTTNYHFTTPTTMEIPDNPYIDIEEIDDTEGSTS